VAVTNKITIIMWSRWSHQASGLMQRLIHYYVHLTILLLNVFSPAAKANDITLPPRTTFHVFC